MTLHATIAIPDDASIASGPQSPAVGIESSMRPHCQKPDACAAKMPGKHCRVCVCKAPEVIARKTAAIRKRQAIFRAAHRAEIKTCIRCGETFSPPPNKTDTVAWAKRQFCGRACAGRGIMERQDVRSRQRAATRERFKDPEYRERHAAVARINGKKAVTFSNRLKGGATRTARAIGWIPLDLRKRYVRLREAYGAARAKPIIRQIMEERRLATYDHALAADFLRKFCAVYRCDEAGRIDPVGSHWRYGTRVMERAGIVRLAIDKGCPAERLVA